jgi:nucleotide-binding universal stress UspA family protein
MLKNIICAIDFSDASVSVINRAKFIHQQSNSQLLLVYCMENHQIQFLSFIFKSSENTADTPANELSAHLNALKNQLLPLEKEVTTRITLGIVAEVMPREAEAFNANLIIIGTSKKSSLQRTFLGSNAIKILRHSPCSVLVTKTNATGTYQRIIIGVDLSSDIQPTLDFISALAPEAEVILAHFYQIPFEGKLTHHADLNDPYLAAYRQELRDEATQKLNIIANKSSWGLLKSTNIVTQGDPAEMLLQLAQDHKCDLIVLNKSNKTAIDDFILGSVTNEVVNLSTRDVLVFNQKHTD